MLLRCACIAGRAQSGAADALHHAHHEVSHSQLLHLCSNKTGAGLHDSLASLRRAMPAEGNLSRWCQSWLVPSGLTGMHDSWMTTCAVLRSDSACLAGDGCREALYGRVLGPFLDDPKNLFVVSSDFCHWGHRFGFTYHDIQKHVSCLETAHSNEQTTSYCHHYTSWYNLRCFCFDCRALFQSPFNG